MNERKIDVIGLGVSNTELIFRLAGAGAYVTLHDRRTEDKINPALYEKLRAAGVSFCLGEGYLEKLTGEIIFRTPGFKYLSPELTAARDRGQVVTSELEVFLALCPCPVYGVTGSDGKTTTATLISELLKSAGKTVHLGGNIGRALLPLLDKISPRDAAVVELSSFQLISMRSSPDVAVITNIEPNHLDVHKDMEEYIAAKCNILDHQTAFSRAVLSWDNQKTCSLSSRVRGERCAFSHWEPVKTGCWMDENGDIFHSVNGNSVLVMNRREIRLPGLHNADNYMAAIAAVWGAVSVKNIVDVARNFAGVEHRIEFVRELHGVKWYNDSIATSPTRTIAGLRAFDQKLIIIAGGYDKNIPFEPMAPVMLERVKTVILTGATAPKIEAALRANPNFEKSGLVILHAESLDDAVKQAQETAKGGDVVSLSPACASFDAFANFEERGRYYKKLVAELQ